MKRARRKLLLDLHLYLGLLCAPYLLIYGLTTLSFNHEWESTTERSSRVRSMAAGAPDPARSPLAAALDARDRLGLMGHVAAWQVEQLADGTLRFQVARPGARYQIAVSPQGEARIDETRSGWLDVMRGLHGAPGFPGSLWGHSWHLYTLLSVVTFSAALVSGPWLWWLRGSQRMLGAAGLVLGSGATALVLLAIW